MKDPENGNSILSVSSSRLMLAHYASTILYLYLSLYIYTQIRAPHGGREREEEEEDLMLIEGVAVDSGKWLDRHHKPPC
jgi:hypothetical protein